MSDDFDEPSEYEKALASQAELKEGRAKAQAAWERESAEKERLERFERERGFVDAKQLSVPMNNTDAYLEGYHRGEEAMSGDIDREIMNILSKQGASYTPDIYLHFDPSFPKGKSCPHGAYTLLGEPQTELYHQLRQRQQVLKDMGAITHDDLLHGTKGYLWWLK